MEVKKKFNEFSILRALAALSVIIIHVTSIFGQFGSTSFSYLFFGTVNKFCNFAVPIFLFLSTALLISNLLKKDKINVGEFYKKRIIKTVPVFIIWVIIYYIYLRTYNTNLINIFEEPGRFIKNYILEGNIYYHLYFMPIIFQLYILMPIIYFICKKLKAIRININISFLITFCLLILFQSLYFIVHKYYIWPHYQNPAIIVFSYSIAIGLGAWIGCNYEGFKNCKLIKVISFFIACISGYLFIRYTLFPEIVLNNLIFPIYTASISVVILCFARLINDKLKIIKQILYKIGEYSFTIYFVHPIILSLIRKHVPNITLLNSYFCNNLINMFIKFILTLGISYFIGVIISIVKEKIILVKKLKLDK